jgi:hypothetical protein
MKDDGPFDTSFFHQVQVKTMRKKIAALMYKLSTVELPKPKNFMDAVRKRIITDEMFEQHGPAMALQWVLGYETDARKKQKGADEEEEQNQEDLDAIKVKQDMAAAQERMAYILACQAAGIPVNETEDDGGDFDPFPIEVHPPLASIDWDEGIVASIRKPIDPKLPEFGKVKRTCR